MRTLKFKLEVITPMFIAGADQQSIENEGLRPASLRGLMRWWFRAIMGGMVTLKDMQDLESRIFGSTQVRSRIKITTATDSKPCRIDIPSKLRYLWFSISMQERKGYPQKSQFEIVLHSDDERALKIASACLWTLVYLGGIGSRMRRGAGSVKIVEASSEIPYEFLFKGKTLREAKSFIEENLEKIFKDFREYADKKYHPPTSPNFAVLSKNYAKISILDSKTDKFNKFEEALSEIGDKYKQFRKDKNLIERLTLGLPIISPHNLRRAESSIRKKLSFEKIKNIKKLEEDKLIKKIKSEKDNEIKLFLSLLLLKKLRQASPLFIGVMDLNGRYAVRLVKFYTCIHKEAFLWKLSSPKEDLNKFNEEIKEVEIKIPQ